VNSSRFNLKRYIRHTVAQNALALYGIQFADYVLPMITVPYLARVLLPAGWGLVVFAQGLSNWLVLIIEYGFGFSATREISRCRDEPARSAEIVAGVVGANWLLMLAALLVAGLASIFILIRVPEFRANQNYLWLALLLAVTQGIRPFWYFQGSEDMRFPASMNVAGRLAAAAGIFLWVKTADSGWKVLLLQVCTGAVVSAIIFVEMYRRIPFRWPTPKLARSALRMGWTMFLSRCTVSLYTAANTLILGFFADPAQVAFYGGAERINRAALGLLQPMSQALFPRMSHIAVRDRDRAAAAARLSLWIFGAFGVVAAALLALLAPWVIRILLGPRYQPVVSVFRVIVLVLPLIALSNVLGTQWMLPFGMDRSFQRIALGAGVLNVSLALLMAPRFGAIGMAWSVVTAETFVTVAMAFALSRSGQRFWAKEETKP
jgi:polysaccharide transporter, PST family